MDKAAIGVRFACIACAVVGSAGVVLIAVLIVYSLVQTVNEQRRKREQLEQLEQLEGPGQPRTSGLTNDWQQQVSTVQQGPHGAKAGQPEVKRVVVLKSESCGHCKQLAPVIVSLQQQGLQIESVDAVAKYAHVPGWFGQNGVKGLPTICEMHGDRVVDIFKGRRTAENIAAYVRQRLT